MARKRKRKAPATSRKLQAEARDLGKRLDALIAQARNAEAGARAGAMQQIRALQKQQAVAQRMLAKLGRQSAAASGPLIAGLQKAWQDMGLAMHQATKRFRQTS
jgi:hypothetical protein